MKKIVIYCKSYRGDVDRTKILLDSILKYNLDGIPFYISCPQSDINLFNQKLGGVGYDIIPDEQICNRSQNTGWKDQQVIKSSFWKLGLCENYVMVDSDSYFIRPFSVSDFISPDGIQYTVMHEQRDLFSWSVHRISQIGFDPMDGFEECRRKIMDVFGRVGRLYDFGPSPVIWNCDVWKSLEENYLIPNDLTFSDAIKSVSSEFTWYGEWLMVSDKKIYPIEPLFKVFHYPGQFVEAKNSGFKEEDYSKVFMGIVMQSNWGAPLKY